MNEDESKRNEMHDRVHSFQEQRSINAAAKLESIRLDALNKKAENSSKGLEWAMAINDPNLFQWLSDAKQARISCGGRSLHRGDAWDRALERLDAFGIPREGREEFAQAAVDAYEQAEK